MIYQLRNEKDLGQNPVRRVQITAKFESLFDEERKVREYGRVKSTLLS